MTDFELLVLEKDKITCSDVLKLLGDYVDQELPPTLLGRIHAHICDCSNCSHLESGYRKTIELASELRDKPIPADVQNRLRKALNERLGLKLEMVE